MEVTGTGKTLGASVDGLDLSQPLSEQDFERVLNSLGRYGVLSFPKQKLTAQQLKDFSSRFGELEVNVAGSYQEPGIPEVMIRSNIVENGKPINRARRPRPGLAHRHVLQQDDRIHQRPLRHRDPSPQRRA